MSYLDIVEHYENCYMKYGDNHMGVDWPKEEDTEKRYKVMLELISFDSHHQKKECPSILDFGCGLGHMYDYAAKQKMNIKYAGLDLSEVFVNRCKEKYPECEFTVADILKGEVIPQYDYIILNGVLTEKRELSYEEMLNYFQTLIKEVYKYCNYGIAFNVMSKDVDWEREDLFHLPLDVLSAFLTKEITRDFIVRYDYGLYEYTVYLYKRNDN